MEFFIYLSKSAAILFLFYLVYIIVLRKDTFFTANRFYLLSGIIAALLLPLVSFTETVFVQLPATVSEVYAPLMTPTISTEPVQAPATPFDWWLAAKLLYGLVVIGMLGQFALRLSSLIRLLRKYPSKKHNGFVFVQVEDTMAPFSFFNYIVYNPQFHSEEELKMILQHEQVHASQWHSLDVLAAHVLRALHWLNPISWWYKKSLEANLEFIADDQTAQHVASKEAYQLALVKASSALQTPMLTTNFYQSFIKKRIIMLNKDHSNKYNQLKLSLIVPVLALFLWSFNTHEKIEYLETITAKEFAATPVQLTFSSLTTNSQLDAIENYLAINHPDMLVKIANRARNAKGELIEFSFQTKFHGNDRFYTRFDHKNKLPFKTHYQIVPASNSTLLVKEAGSNGTQFEITKEKLEILSPLLDLKTEPLFEKNENLGDNPLYIINNKSYQQNELPLHSEIKLDGEVKSYSKKEGIQKYGSKGKDGVLHFDGVSTFVKSNEAEKLPSTHVTSQGTILNTQPTQFSRLNSITRRIQFPITKNTTDAQLDVYAAEAKSKYGYEVTFTVTRNTNREITGVRIAYDGPGNSGNISSNNGGPIADSYFYIDNETGAAGFMNEGSKERMEEMRERMEVRRIEMEERREEREVEMEERRGLLEEKGEERRALMEERRELMRERREIERERMREMRKNGRLFQDSISVSGYAERRGLLAEREELEEHEEHEEHLFEDEAHERTFHSGNVARGYAYENQNSRANLAHVNHDEHAISISKNTTNEELAEMKAYLSTKGIKFNYKRVKRNSRGQITSMKLNIDNGKGSKVTKSISADNGKAIDRIYMKI